MFEIEVVNEILGHEHNMAVYLQVCHEDKDPTSNHMMVSGLDFHRLWRLYAG